MTDAKIREIISSCAVFSVSSPETLSVFLSCRRQSFSAGETIYSTGSFEKSLGIVLSGKVEISGAAEGKSVKLNAIGKSGIFGVAALFGAERDYVSTVTSKTASEILFVTEPEMKRIISSDDAVMLAYVSFLSEKIRFLNGKITAFTAKNTDAAVALFLLGKSEDDISVNMSRLSRQLDIGRTSLYRSFDNLTSLGAISYTDGTVKILSRKVLKSVR